MRLQFQNPLNVCMTEIVINKKNNKIIIKEQDQ